MIDCFQGANRKLFGAASTTKIKVSSLALRPHVGFSENERVALSNSVQHKALESFFSTSLGDLPAPLINHYDQTAVFAY